MMDCTTQKMLKRYPNNNELEIMAKSICERYPKFDDQYVTILIKIFMMPSYKI